MAEVSLESAPRKTRELFEKAASAMERGNLDYAIDMFMSILEREPRLLQVRKFLRTAQLRKYTDKKGGGLTHMITSLTGFSSVMKAQSALKKKPLTALYIAEKLMSSDPLNPQFYNLLVKAAAAADLPEVAIHTLEIVKDANPKDTAMLYHLADLYKQTGNPGGARECYERVVTLKPNDPRAIKALKDAQAMQTMKEGKWNEAKSYRDVIKDTDEAKLLEQQSKAVKSTRDVDELIVELEGKIEQEPDNVNLKRSLADLFARAKRYDEAIALLEASSAQAGGGDPQIDRALSRIQLEKYDESIGALREEGREDEATALEQEKRDFLLRDTEERVRRYPNDLQFKYEYGVQLYEREAYTEAIQQFQLAQRNPQRRLRALYYLALCFKAKNQLDIAAEQLEKAASELSLMDDTKKDILYELGTINEEMGNGEKAVEYFKEIYAVDISYRDVASKIESSYKKS